MPPEKSNVIQSIDDMDDLPVSSTQSADSGGKISAMLAGKGNLVIAAMMIAAAGSIGLMAMKFTPKTASAEEAQARMELDATIAMLDVPTPVKDYKSGAIVQSLYCDVGRRQIPMARLSGNPFIFDPPEPAPKSSTSQSSNSNNKTNHRRMSDDELVSRATREVRKLTLESVLVGPNGPVAMISDNLVAEGRKVGVWTISEIHPLKVILTWRNRKYILKIRE